VSVVRVALPAVLAILAGTTPALAAPKPTEIKKAFKSGDAGKVKDMLGALEGNLDDKAVKTVLKEAPKLKPLGVYEDLVKTLATAEGKALEVLTKGYKKEKKGEMRFLIVDALGKNPAEAVEATLATAVSDDKDPPVRVMAARALGKRYTTTAVDTLIPLLAEFEEDPKEERIKKEVLAALGNLTGQDLTVAEDWTNYWNAHKDAYTKPADHAEGETKTRSKLIDRMAKQRPAELKTLTRMKDADLLVIDGNDRVDKVLDVLGLKHKELKLEDYEKQDFDPETQVLLFECPGSKSLSEDGIKKLREFVAKGGYAFVSDWHLGKTLAKAFPEVVTFLKEAARVDDNTPNVYKDNRGKPAGLEVTIQPIPATINHPLMRDVFPLNAWEGRSFDWKLHERCHLVNDGKSAVVPLVICPEIKSQGSTTVAFTFNFTGEGGGRPVTGKALRKVKRAGCVLFVSSHFKDDEDGEDGYALQQLLLNFVLEKQAQRKGQRAK
jgi:hypothetical protein